jgi:opacity protein-like surface antigen
MTEIPQDVTTKMDIWSFQLGSKYSIIFYTIKPFITTSLTANYFDDFYIEFSEPNCNSEYRSYENGMRYGYNVGIGFAYNIFSNINLELSSNYNSFNVLNKRDGEELLNSVNVFVIFYYQIM